MILDLNQIKCNVASLECGKSKGTAFLISKNKALTAYHCIKDYSEELGIQLTFKHLKDEEVVIKATPLNINFSLENNIDAVILELEEDVLDVEYFQLSVESIRSKAKWQTFGYPQIERLDGIELHGEVMLEKGENNIENFDLIVQHKEKLLGTTGLSGSPLIIDGKVSGIITYDRGKRETLGVVSIKKVTSLLTDIDIKICSDEEEVKKVEVVENLLTKNRIMGYINKHRQGYLFVKGVPGSGKTTFTHNLTLDDENVEILGKYFLKGIEEEYNIQYNSDKEIFGKWILNKISSSVFNKPFREGAMSDGELIKSVHDYFSELSKRGNIQKGNLYFL